MKLLIDSGNIDQIKEINDLGIICGATTNPTLISRECTEHFEQLRRIRGVLGDKGLIFAQVVSKTADEMVNEAKQIAELHKNMVVKLPMCPEALKAVKRLSGLGIKTTITLVFSVAQALFCAQAGATMIAPFVGRLDDIGTDGLKVINDICEMYRKNDIETKVLVGSLKHPHHIANAAISGADYLTIPYNVYGLSLKHPLSSEGIDLFDIDYKKLQDALAK